MKQVSNSRMSDQASGLVGIAGLAILFLVAFLAFLGQQVFLCGFCFFIFLLCLFARIWGLRALERIDIRIDVPQKRIFAGDRLLLRYRVENMKFLPLIWLEIAHRLPQNGCITPEDERSVRPVRLPEAEEEKLRQEYEKRQMEEARKEDPQLIPSPDYTCPALCKKCAFLLWYHSAEWEAVWIAQKRGIFQAGQVLLRSGDGFGLSETESFQMASNRPVLLVYPQIVPVRPDPFLQNLWDAHSGAKGYMEDCTVIQGERDYQPTDSWKRIDWRMAARRTPLQVKVFETILPKSVHFLLDAPSFFRKEERFEEELEESISILASLLLRLDGSQVWCGLSLPATRYAAQFNQLPNGEGPDPLLAALASFDCSDKVFLLEPAGFPREQLGQLCIFTYSLSSPSLFRLLDALGGTGITIVPYMQEGGVPDHCRVLPLRSLKGGHAHG